MDREERTVVRVLAAVDLTPIGRRVADRSRMVAEVLGANLELLHVVEPLSEAFIDAGVARLLSEQRRDAVGKLGEWCRERSKVPVEVSTVKGAPVWEIVKAAKKADLVVVGSSSLDSGSIGPISLRVVEGHRGDVLVVRRQPRAPYRRVLVATDMSEASAAGVELAMRIAPEATITIVHGLSSRFDAYMVEAGMFPEEVQGLRGRRLAAAEEAVEAMAARWGDRVRALVASGSPGTVVEETVRRRSADLVVVSNRGAGATKMTLLGSVASLVLETVPTDVAVARVPGDFRRP